MEKVGPGRWIPVSRSTPDSRAPYRVACLSKLLNPRQGRPAEGSAGKLAPVAGTLLEEAPPGLLTGGSSKKNSWPPAGVLLLGAR